MFSDLTVLSPHVRGGMPVMPAPGRAGPRGVVSAALAVALYRPTCGLVTETDGDPTDKAQARGGLDHSMKGRCFFRLFRTPVAAPTNADARVIRPFARPRHRAPWGPLAL